MVGSRWATRSRSFPTIPVSPWRTSTRITSYGGGGTGERGADGWWTGGRSSGGDERPTPGGGGARVGGGGAAHPDLRCNAHPPRQDRPACDPHECERGDRDRGCGGAFCFPWSPLPPLPPPRPCRVPYPS